MSLIEEVEIRHFHLFCGLGGGARGFNRGRAEVGCLRARFRCIGGVDVDAAAVRDFGRLAGVSGTVLDLFDREQYLSFHGIDPPDGWRPAGPEDIRRAAGNERPHIVFTSAPCKGFSGLLSESKSRGAKYQALNRLTLRGIWLTLEAWSDDPPELIIFENVPRIATRGRGLLDRIGELLRAYGYAVAETTHDCGEIGGLAQSRKRFLLVARHASKVPAFLYQPARRPLRAVGDVLGKMPLPGDLRGGPMHTLPNLQWKTWVRLAFVEAGSDWRSLNRLRVVDGKLADYLIVPAAWYQGILGVQKWDAPSCTVTGRADPTTGAFAVADPRFEGGDYHTYGVKPWSQPSETVTGKAAAGAGAFSVADPRLEGRDYHTNIYAVANWKDAARTVTSASHTAGGAPSVADPRLGNGPQGPHFNNVYRIVEWSQPSPTVSAGHGPSAGGLGVADPRPPRVDGGLFGKYAITEWSSPARTVIAGDDSGAYGIADPRPGTAFDGGGKYKVTPFGAPANTVIAESGTGNGAFAVADPRVLHRAKGDHYLTGGHYGVVPWGEASGAISGAACHDNGPWSVADPRMPEDTEKVVAVIRSLDGTWHRPFTTLELAALQSLVDPENMFDLDGNSDSAKRERIGNAVPPSAAQAIANVMGETLLLSWSGESFMLSDKPIWVRPIAVALSVRLPG